MELKEIYKKSWNVAIKHKALWVIGAAVMAFSGGGAGGNFNSFSNPSFKDLEKYTKSPAAPDFQPLLNFFTEILRNVPTGTWVALGLSIVIAIILGIAVSVVASSWATGALLGGVEEALDGKSPSIKSSSSFGFKHLKSLVWLRVVPGLLLALFILLCILLCVVLTLAAKFIGMFFIFITVVLTLIGAIILSIIQVWSVRIAVIENKSGKEAFFEGWKIAKSNFLDMLGLGTVNCFAGCLVGCGVAVVLIPVGALGIGTLIATGVFSAGVKNYYALIPALSIVLVLAIITIVVMTLVMSIYTVFNFSTWDVLYRQIRTKEKEGKKDGK